MSATYIIQKTPHTGDIAQPYMAYSGPTCESAGVDRGMVYNNLGDACADAIKLSRWNGVGFSVVVVGQTTIVGQFHNGRAVKE